MTLSSVRKARGMTMKQLAAATGLSHSSIAAYEYKSRRPSPRAAERIAQVLELSVEEMWTLLYKSDQNPDKEAAHEYPHRS